MSAQPTVILNPELADYHTARLNTEHAKAREALAWFIAEHVYGLGPSPETPDLYAVLRSVGFELALPLADAVLACPGITYTGGES